MVGYFSRLMKGAIGEMLHRICWLRFTRFKEIVFSGSTVYVATDAGVLVSETGEHWRVITDRTDTRVVITQFAVDGTDVYGIGDTGAYRLDTRGRWEQISSDGGSGR